MEKKHEEDECHQKDIFTKRTLWKLSFMFEMILSLFWWGRFERYWWWKKCAHIAVVFCFNNGNTSRMVTAFSPLFSFFSHFLCVCVCVLFLFFRHLLFFNLPKRKKICCCFTFDDPFRSLPDSLWKAHHYFIISL